MKIDIFKVQITYCIQNLYLILEVEIKLSKFANWGFFFLHMLVLIINPKNKHFHKSINLKWKMFWSHWPLPIIFYVRIIAFEALWDFPSMSEADLLRFRTKLHRGQSPLNKVTFFQFFGHSFFIHKLSNFLKLQLCAKLGY